MDARDRQLDEVMTGDWLAATFTARFLYAALRIVATVRLRDVSALREDLLYHDDIMFFTNSYGKCIHILRTRCDDFDSGVGPPSQCIN